VKINDQHRFIQSSDAIVYLLAMSPGMFFMCSVAIGNIYLAKFFIQRLNELYSFPPYVILLIFIGFGFIIGQAFIMLSWLFEMVLFQSYRLPRKVFRKIFGGPWLYKWLGNHQAFPPNRNFLVSLLSKLVFRARVEEVDDPDAKSVRWCLAAAAEKLLEKQYGIDSFRATGKSGGEWPVWYSALGKPTKLLAETLNAGRVTLASGLAGAFACSFAPQLKNTYFLSMCTLFIFSGLWTASWYFFQLNDSVKLDFLRLRSILQELRECSSNVPEVKDADRN
jgi:hypothetical protein